MTLCVFFSIICLPILLKSITSTLRVFILLALLVRNKLVTCLAKYPVAIFNNKLKQFIKNIMLYMYTRIYQKFENIFIWRRV